ncbi:MAG TPA: metalloregulator ArsR/SmtB family transcription factor [Nocardioides sp.]|uniref:ArsR/SmtB family transcription factor n=1 Tax=Nocardioides sp. TaxID=35761 RepID=UPI002E2F04BF|nr:metalloregulator ArsR/SmtB family transcription factor [Nocardioides sp.]HEX5088870.1 metalloregulator ArsR/SmtB family transcription factor [Nocardioides sp.]
MTVAVLCAALGDPTRAAMVERLSRGPASISELAAPHAMTLTAARKHVGVLVDAGWVERRKRGRVVTCRLRPEPFGELEGWLTDRRAFWTSALGRLGAVLDEEQP